MKNNKGQALVEFVMILPVFIWILLAIIDFGNIMYQKYTLENDIDIISDMYISDKNKIDEYVNKIKANISYENKEKYTTIKLVKEIKVNTIILNNIIGKNYKISSSKTIYNGEEHE